MNQNESIIERVKGIVLSPKKEWRIILQEEKSTATVFRRYLLPLSIISIVACYIGYGIVGSKQGMFGMKASAELGFRYAALNFANLIASPFVTALVISLLAPSFKADKNFGKAFNLIVYSYTPLLVASVFYIIPSLSLLVFLTGFYGFYLFLLGLKPMTNVPKDKSIAYFIAILASTIAVYFVISLIIRPIILH